MEPYLYHGIRNYDLDRLINILKTGYILPKKELASQFKVDRTHELDLNGQSWISLCQKSIFDDSVEEISHSSFDSFVYKNLCFVFDYNVDGIVYPNHMIYDFYGPKYIRSLVDDESSTRVSTYSDEVQTSIKIPVSKSIAIGYPKAYLSSSDCDVASQLMKIRKALCESKLDVPIVDSSYYDFADTKENIKKYTILK